MQARFGHMTGCFPRLRTHGGITHCSIVSIEHLLRFGYCKTITGVTSSIVPIISCSKLRMKAAGLSTVAFSSAVLQLLR
jgi:hypothetical protein